MELKYVITDNGSFALFTDTTEHFGIARALWGTPVGAGFARLDIKVSTPEEKEEFDTDTIVRVQCYGSSHTADLKSRGEEDSKIITKKINRQY